MFLPKWTDMPVAMETDHKTEVVPVLTQATGKT